MSGKRNSGKKHHNFFDTPGWVLLDGLAPFFPVKGLVVLEPACGTGKMVRALVDAGAGMVIASDILKRKRLSLSAGMAFHRRDFLKTVPAPHFEDVDALITNPPFGEQGRLAEQFIEKGLAFLRAAPAGKPVFLALLLSVDFDLAVGRVHLFDRCPEFHAVIRLRRRIEWFKRKKKRNGKKSSGPSQNHAWFIWKSEPRAPGVYPVVLYAPGTTVLL